MSDVSTKYSAAPSQNTSLGGLSLEENQTRFRDINDLFRRLMADAKQESNEIRILISDATSKAADAKAAAEAASGTTGEIYTTVNSMRNSVATAVSSASNAMQSAASAVEVANGIASDAASAAALAQANNGLIDSLNARVVNLEQTARVDSALVLTDNETVTMVNGMLKAIDVKAGEGLASARGQIGRTAVSANATLDALVADGWYAVGGGEVSGLPEGIASGIVRVSSGYASDCYAQTLLVPGDELRLFMRNTQDGGTTWGEWKEAVFASAIGNGLHFENGVLSGDFSNVLPETTAEDTGKCLGAEGQWLSVAKPEDIQAVYAAVGVVERGLADLRSSLAAVQSTIAMGPDNVTIMVTDGTMTVPLYLGASSEAAGRAGLVPPASAGDEGKFLRGDGTFAAPALSIPDYDGTASGLVHPAEQGEQELYLRGDGTWADPAAAIEARVEALEALDLASYSERLAELESFATSSQIDALWDGETEGGE